MNAQGSETRHYGLIERQYTPSPQPRHKLFQKYGIKADGTPEANYTKKERIWWSVRRLQDKFARTNDQRCLDKAKELTRQWLS